MGRTIGVESALPPPPPVQESPLFDLHHLYLLAKKSNISGIQGRRGSPELAVPLKVIGLAGSAFPAIPSGSSVSGPQARPTNEIEKLRDEISRLQDKLISEGVSFADLVKNDELNTLRYKKQKLQAEKELQEVIEKIKEQGGETQSLYNEKLRLRQQIDEIVAHARFKKLRI